MVANDASSVPALVNERPFRPTPTERQILEHVLRQEGRPCTKAAIAEALGRSEKGIDRCVSHLRREGLLLVRARYGKNGTQLANAYRLSERGTQVLL